MNTIIIDYRTTKNEASILQNHELTLIKTEKHAKLYDAINGHPDIQLLPLHDSGVIIEKDASSNMIESLRELNIDVFFSSSPLGTKYPSNVILNSVMLKDYFIHNMNFTDKSIMPHIRDKICINVKQGYSKCSTAVVSDNALISSDPSIIKSLEKYPIDVLALPPGDIELPGLDYGFIGGTCGLISQDKLAFFGNLDFYKYGSEIKKFLFKHNVEPIYLSNSHLIDRGSILRVK